jgi:RNA polymerase sigma-70 factor (ECF subfamily)
MTRVQHGDQAAFNALHTRHSQLVLSRIYGKTNCRTLSADISQDVWLSVHKHRDTWQQGMGSFRTWILKITQNAVIAHWRKKSQRPFELNHQTFLEKLSVPGTADLAVMLDEAISALPTKLKESFIMGPCEGFDHNEIASMLKISPDNARKRITRARSALKTLLSD